MTESQRQAFAHALTMVRNGRFEGSRKAAYTAAKVNAATWTRAEAGESLKEHSIAKIVSNLFPRTDGDWSKLLNENGNFELSYWDLNGLRPEEAGPIEKVLGIADDPHAIQVEDWSEANRELRRLRTQLARTEYRLDRIEEHLGFNPFANWSVDEDAAQELPTAARKGSSSGRQRRAAQDAAGEENQDPETEQH